MWRLSTSCSFVLLFGMAAAADPGPSVGDEAALRQAAETYADAFNRQEAKALAALWSEDAEYISAAGERTEGREALQALFTSLFADNSGARLVIAVESVRLVHPEVAVEHGSARTEFSDGRTNVDQYTAVYVRQDGRWLLSSVREVAAPASPTSLALQPLAPLIGDWTFEAEDGRVETVSRWTLDNNFVKRSFTVFVGKKKRFYGTEVVGWDAAAREVRSWTFTSDGSFSAASWREKDDGWVEVAADGTETEIGATPVAALAALANPSESSREQTADDGTLSSLAWMVGEWADADEGVLVHTVCRQTLGGRFLVREFTAFAGDQANMSGVRVIGWDAHIGHIRSWVFDTDGGHSEGLWTAEGENRWKVLAAGVLPDGGRSTAVQVFEKVDQDTLLFQAMNREVDGELLPGLDPFAIVRIDEKQKGTGPAKRE